MPRALVAMAIALPDNTIVRSISGLFHSVTTVGYSVHLKRIYTLIALVVYTL